MVFNSFEDIQAAWEEAENYRIQSNLLKAYDIYRNILERRLTSGVRFIGADTTVIQALADMTILFGQFQAADDLLSGLVGLYKKAGNFPLAYFTILKRLQLALDRGLLLQADDLLHSLSPQTGDIESIDDISPSGLIQWEASCLWENADRNEIAVLFAHLYLAMGRLWAANGQYGDGLIILERGLSYTQSEYPSLARQTALPIQFSIAAAHLEKGNLETAQSHLNHLRTQFDEQQPEFLVRWLELSGKLNLLYGELGQALEKFQQVQTVCRELGLSRAVIQSTLNLAHVLITLNQISLTKDYLHEALENAQDIQDEELIKRIQLLLSLADARSQSSFNETSIMQMRQGKLNNTPTLENNKENFSFTSQSANYLALFDDRVLQFRWMLGYFGLDSANQQLSHIQCVFNSSDSQLIQIRINILEGILAYYQGVESQDTSKIRWAALTLDDVRETLQELNLKSELWQVQQVLDWCYTRLNAPSFIQEELAQEANELLTELTQSLSAKDQATFWLNKWTKEEKYLATKINQIKQLQELIDNDNSFFLRRWRQWQVMQRLHYLLKHIDRYKDVLAKGTIQEHEQSANSLPNFSLIRRILTHPRDRITVFFLILPDRVLVVRIGWLMLNFQVIDTTRIEVRELVQRWHKKIKSTIGTRDLSASPDEDLEDFDLNNIANEITDVSSQLSELLQLDSLLKHIPKRIKSITIVPDDILHGFPFATILYQGKYLIEKYSLSITYESTLQNRPQLFSRFTKQALLVGVSQGTPPFSSLFNVRKELEKIEKWLIRHRFKQVTLKDNDAQKNAILKHLTKTQFLHIACHGIFEYNHPDRSGLVLIPTPYQPPEILSLRELSNLNLTQLHHATLSSCWSADHFILPGRWIISLPETLWRSGTQSILGCLWEVYDDVAVNFMTRFYHHLETLPRDQALQKTQLEYIDKRNLLANNTEKRLANPLFWSGFNLYGNFRKLNLTTLFFIKSKKSISLRKKY